MKLFKILLLFIGFLFIFSCSQNPQNTNTDEEQVDEEIMNVDTSQGLFAVINSSKGKMIAKLFEDKAPMTVANFIALAEGNMPNTYRKAGLPFYDSLKFHRVISLTNGDNENFMIQGGDPTGTGMGGESIWGKPFEDEVRTGLKHTSEGILSMANAGPNTNGSQFFITLKDTPWLDGKHTVFGKVINGIDVVRAIGKVKTNQNDKPLTDVVMQKVTIEKRVK